MAKPKVVDAPVVAPRHGRLRRRRPVRSVFKYLSIGLVVVLVSTVSVVGFKLMQMTSSIDTVELSDAVDLPNLAEQQGSFNVLLVGSDSRAGQSSVVDGHDSSPLNDVTMVLHVSADQQSATVISFPRDLIVNFPACPATEESGGAEIPAAYDQQLNSALGRGGLACVAEVVSDLSGLDIPYAALIDFDGVVAMSTAVGGVDVCFAGPIDDPYTGLLIPEPGTYSLEGEQALQFLRSRHGVGDGSDLARISSQQVFLSSLIRTMQSDEVLTDVTRLYQIAQVATQNMTLSTSLNDIGTMVAMAQVLADIPLDTMQFIQYPTASRGDGRVVPIEGTADAVMEMIANDEQVTLDEEATGEGSTTETPVPTDPATGYAIDPETGYPVDPATEYPINPDTGLPFYPETGESIDVATGFPISAETGLPYDPTTGFPIDAATGWAYDEATDTYWDPESGNEIDPTTGQQIDEATGLPIDEETGWPIDEATGWPINPDTGEPTDPTTIGDSTLPGVTGQSADQETCVVPFGY